MAPRGRRPPGHSGGRRQAADDLGPRRGRAPWQAASRLCERLRSNSPAEQRGPEHGVRTEAVDGDEDRSQSAFVTTDVKKIKVHFARVWSEQSETFTTGFRPQKRAAQRRRWLARGRTASLRTGGGPALLCPAGAACCSRFEQHETVFP